jgi:hypothetical protein
MLATSELVIEKENEATELILIIANNIYGSNIAKKEDVLIDLILNLINSKYPKCTIQDLRNTYISGEIPIVKRQGTSLNRDEFIEPLNTYFDKKNRLIFEIEKVQRKEAEEQDRIKKDLEFKQTAKNIFLWQGRSYIRKGLEAYFTLLIEVIWGKERIMEVYLNSIEMGEGVYGAEAAAQHWYGTSAANLTKNQAAGIAAILPNPRKYKATNSSSYIENRKGKIVRIMRHIAKPEY